jgi:hypothetical protein
MCLGPWVFWASSSWTSRRRSRQWWRWHHGTRHKTWNADDRRAGKGPGAPPLTASWTRRQGTCRWTCRRHHPGCGRRRRAACRRWPFNGSDGICYFQVTSQPFGAISRNGEYDGIFRIRWSFDAMRPIFSKFIYRDKEDGYNKMFQDYVAAIPTYCPHIFHRRSLFFHFGLVSTMCQITICLSLPWN